jgi:hypothetical protein
LPPAQPHALPRRYRQFAQNSGHPFRLDELLAANTLLATVYLLKTELKEI